MVAFAHSRRPGLWHRTESAAALVPRPQAAALVVSGAVGRGIKQYTTTKRGCVRRHASKEWQEHYAQKEKTMEVEVEDLKRAATETMERLAREVEEAASKDVAGGNGAGQAVDEQELRELQQRVKWGISAMQDGLVERDTEVRLLLLAALSGEHVLYIGPPGTAKSELGRRLSKLCDGSYFERLLTRFSVPEELFGPLSMRALEEDKYIRQTAGYLPRASVAFIDEIFKANSAILNTLLTLLNERLFDNGSERLAVPLLCLVGASNELPESEELDALYDRFLLRRQVKQISAGAASPHGGYANGSLGGVLSRKAASTERAASAGLPDSPCALAPHNTAGGGGAWPLLVPEALLEQVAWGRSHGLTDLLNYTGGNTDTLVQPDSEGAPLPDSDDALAASTSPLLSVDDFVRTREAAVKSVQVPKRVVELVVDLREHLQQACEPPLYVSDRRLVKAIAILQVAAYANGRSSVTEYDCLLLQHILWQRPEESERIYDWLLSHLSVSEDLEQVNFLLAGLFGRACKHLADEEKVVGILREVQQLRDALCRKLVTISATLAGGFPVVSEHLWLSSDEREAICSAMLPKLKKAQTSVERTLFEVVALETALDKRAHAVVLASLMPRYWAAFIRNSSPEEAKDLGTVVRPFN